MASILVTTVTSISFVEPARDTGAYFVMDTKGYVDLERVLQEFTAWEQVRLLFNTRVAHCFSQ